MPHVFGFIMYGIPNPFNGGAIAQTVLYTTRDLPTAGRPAELSGATVLPIIPTEGLPGINWGADPRHPTGQEEDTCTVTLVDDGPNDPVPGALGKLFLEDRSAPFWGVESNRISATANTITLVNEAEPEDDVPYYLGNECVTLVLIAGPTRAYTREFDLHRAQCGSLARAHVLRPSDYSAGEDGSQDRLYLRSKPDWGEGWLCGLYLFLLDANGAIVSYVLRRGVVAGEPTPRELGLYDITVKLIEGRINSHTVGENSQEITLSHLILVHRTEGDFVDAMVPKEVSLLLPLDQAESLFNEPLAPRGSPLISTSYVLNLSSRLFADEDVIYEIKVAGEDTWVYELKGISKYHWISDGTFYQAVKLSCVLREDGFAAGSTVVVRSEGGGETWLQFKPWFNNNLLGGGPNAQGGSNVIVSGTSTQGPAPTVTLRLHLHKTMVQSFLLLCISRDGSSGGAYDKLIGGFGAGLPQSYFNLGSVAADPLTINGNTIELLKLDQWLNPVNDYYFDLSQGVSLKDFLTNEFICSQVLLGSYQDGLIGVRSWVHEVPSTVTLQAVNEGVVPGTRLSAVKKLELYWGTRVLSLEPTYHRGVRYLGLSSIKPEEVQPVRVWREGLQLGPTNINVIDLNGLIRVFYQIFGGAPRVYEVSIAIEDYVNDGIEFGDAVSWADDAVPTPQGLSIDADFFVIKVDLDYDNGLANLWLIENTLLTQPTTTVTGKTAPTLKVTAVSAVSSTVVDVTVDRIDGTAFAPLTDFGGLYPSIRDNSSYVRIDNFDQAPIGELEPVGYLVAYAKITTITSGSPDVFRLTFDAEYIRDPITAAIDLFTVGETRINLPQRVTAEASLSGDLIEPDAEALPDQQNYVSFQPLRPIYGAGYTPGH